MLAFTPHELIRRHFKVAAYAVVGMLVGALLVWRFDHVVTLHKLPIPILSEAIIAEEGGEAPEPTRLRIEAADVDAAFESPLGLRNNYEIQVPESYDDVGYYKHGPKPGELGPAVILGHVDSYEDSAVFYRVAYLEEGDTIEVDRADGSTAVFVVESLEHHSQAGFPTEKVYSDLDYAGLRLITCSGSFDRGEQRYSHNLIVFAKLIDVRQSASS